MKLRKCSILRQNLGGIYTYCEIYPYENGQKISFFEKFCCFTCQNRIFKFKLKKLKKSTSRYNKKCEIKVAQNGRYTEYN